ncbi:thioredoxin reductase [Malaciobacter halophilus]|nr:thioredoxin-disulfide reductase [Malaciobacter halophilus]AXH08546.1 thioredoxin reductase [Malaciobacter halophilus]AXH08684.1 thioredoxin reductase [Malaciobacter halophilus]
MLDLAIIGGGPAGLTAGLYATRGGLKDVVMFEMGMPGGQITGSSEIENYPGQEKVMSGLDLMQSWPEQAMKFGLKHEMKKITSVVKNDDIFTLTSEDGNTFESKAVLLATGSVPRRAGFKGEDEFFGRGISTCATCDGFFYKGKEVAVIGGGDSALEEAVYLSKICSKVYLVHRRDTYRAAPSTIEHMKNTQNIEEVTNVDVEEVYGDMSGVTGLKVKSKIDGAIKDLEVPGVFVFVGRDVLNESIKNDDGSFICDTDKQGQVVVDLKMRTSLPGLYAAGDVRIDAAKQVVCAAGDGATAAVDIIEFLG